MKLAITVCATEKYTYAMGMQAQAVCNAVKEYERSGYDPIEKLDVILAGSRKSSKLQRVAAFYKSQLENPDYTVETTIIEVEDKDDHKNYKTSAQLLIAKLRSLVFNKAKQIGATHCFTLDSDVIPKANSLYCMRHTLDFDMGYYGVASCIYPSQGGGLFLCGRGTQKRQILEDIFADEKEIPEAAQKRVEEIDKKIEEVGKLLNNKETFSEANFNKMAVLHKKKRCWQRFFEKRCKPKTTNVFELNSKKWRRRGWFDFAYPAIGRGAIVPSDWMGFGCALIGSKALNLVDFSGYNGGGTEDLYIIWNRWYPAGVKIAAIPHCPADHIIRSRDKHDEGKYWHIFTFHETDGEFVDHLRQEKREFFEFDV